MDFLIYYCFQLIKSNLFIAYDILTPKNYMNPGIIQVPIAVKSNLGLLMFNNLLSMTPGSLSIDISEDKQIMTVHLLYIDSKEKALQTIKKIEGKVKKITK
jgi:multicomponent Na+:H+ antiporter subunit E